MLCPFCHRDQDRVIDSRSTEAGGVVRRRRQCLACNKRFTTYERAETDTRLMVIKKDSTRAPFDREKIRHGVQQACYKRPVSSEDIDALVNRVEEEIFRGYDREVPSRAVGQLVCQQLRQLDKVAYIRFASVYHDFKDLGELVTEAQEVLSEAADAPGQQPLFEDPPAAPAKPESAGNI